MPSLKIIAGNKAKILNFNQQAVKMNYPRAQYEGYLDCFNVIVPYNLCKLFVDVGCLFGRKEAKIELCW